MKEINPNEIELKKYCWDNIRKIIERGGFELYNAIMLDIDRVVITEIDEIQKRMGKK